MKALFIGGTGVISTAVGALALARGWELTLLNRGTNAVSASEDMFPTMERPGARGCLQRTSMTKLR